LYFASLNEIDRGELSNHEHNGGEMTEHILQGYRVDIDTRTDPDGPMHDADRGPYP
jgi:hypothetical protein